MPKAKIPDLDWKNYTPATVNELDILAIEQGQIENLDCNCLDCFPEVAELHEIENNTSPPQQQERSYMGHLSKRLQKSIPTSIHPI